MVAEVSSLRQRKPSGFMNHLSSAICEWFLIFLLFLDAAFSYFLTRFALYCELKTPCLLCSRLDLVFGEKKPGRYPSLLCNNHREEISSLAYCSIHGKLADVHDMCEECLATVALQNKTNDESFRLLVGKLSVDVERTALQTSLLNKNIRLGSSIRRTCSCCDQTWRTKSNADKLPELMGVGLGASKANVKPPLPRVPGRSRFSRRDSLKRRRDKFTSTSNSGHKLCHVGYTKLKLSSDSESEFPFSEEEDDGNTSSCSKNLDEKSESSVRLRRRSVRGKSVDSVSSYKETREISEVKLVTVNQTILPDLINPNVGSSLPDAIMDHGLKELSLDKSYDRRGPRPMQELISLDDKSTKPDVAGSSSGASFEITNTNASLPHVTAISVLSELLSLCNNPSLTNTKITINEEENEEKRDMSEPKDVVRAVVETSSDVARPLELNDTNVMNISSQNIIQTESHMLESINISDFAKIEQDTEPVGQTSASESALASKDVSPRAHEEKHELDTEEVKKPVPKDVVRALAETSSDVARPLEPTDTNTMDISSQNIEQTETCKLESIIVSDAAKIEQDMEPLAQVSASESALASKDASPRAHEEKHESSIKESEEDTKAVPQVSRTSEAGSSSKETSPRAHGKHEDSSIKEVPRPSSLERNDSNHESSDEMIDRLRREVEQGKTTISSLYKELEEERNAASVAANEAMAMITRLQEEKAALHMEALQYLRMMEEQAEYDMEALERANDLITEKEKELQDLESEMEIYRNNPVQESSGAENLQREISAVDNNHVVEKNSGDSKKIMKAHGDSSSFEDEKNYISDCLKKLEEKLHQPCSCSDQRPNGINDIPNVLHSDKTEETVLDPQDSPSNEETVYKHENDFSQYNGNLGHDSQNEFPLDESAFENETSVLHYMLEVLDIERDVLKHASNLLPNGTDGLRFIQGIAHQLQSLREIGFKKR